MKLYSYWRSSTSYRVRIALNLKGIDYEIEPINLLAGEQLRREYEQLNPIKGVPSLVLEDGTVLTQSMAILRYLQAIAPTPPLLPKHPLQAARIEAASLIIASDIHPVSNLRVLEHLRAHGGKQADARAWINHWTRAGLKAFGALLPDARFCFGDSPSLADICLVPQLYNAHRWGTDLSGLDHLLAIEKNCLAMAAFAAARPENQPDAQLG